jgi:hypothetical protein
MKKINLQEYLLSKYGKTEKKIIAKFSSQKLKYVTQVKKEA